MKVGDYWINLYNIGSIGPIHEKTEAHSAYFYVYTGTRRHHVIHHDAECIREALICTLERLIYKSDIVKYGPEVPD